MTKSETRPTSRVAVDTAVETEASDGAQDQAWADTIAAATVDPRIWSGPFAQNVWGGRYEMRGLLGEGSQGSTFSGTDRKTDAAVAVKLFDLGKAKDWKALQLFEREVETLKRLSHPGVPQFIDVIVDADSGARALVMTAMPGETLANVVRRQGPLPEKRLWGVLVDAAGVLAAVHKEGLVHRDLKPENLVQKPDGTIGVVDFGGVGHVRAAQGSTVVGTFGYMAPEQLYGAQTAATDLYALGATLLTLATGKEPEDQPRQGLSIDVDAAAPQLSAPLRTVLKALLAPEPTGRPADAQALLVELRRIAEGPKAGQVVEPDDVFGDAPLDRRQDVEIGVQVFTGVLGLVFSVLGAAFSVVIGQVLLPIVFGVVSLFLKEQDKERLEAWRGRIVEASRVAQRGFQDTAVSSARSLEEVSDRERARKLAKRDAKRARRQARKAGR